MDLTLTVARGAGSTKKKAYVSARLGGRHVNHSVTITAQLTGGAAVTLDSGPVDANGVLTAVHVPRTTTTYHVTYA